MNEKELIEYFIYERMELHWRELYHFKTDDRQEEGRTLDQFEAILKRLTKKERKTIDRFLDLTTERNARETAYLYTCGVKDGIRAIKFINILYTRRRSSWRMAMYVVPVFSVYLLSVFLMEIGLCFLPLIPLVCAILP